MKLSILSLRFEVEVTVVVGLVEPDVFQFYRLDSGKHFSYLVLEVVDLSILSLRFFQVFDPPGISGIAFNSIA